MWQTNLSELSFIINSFSFNNTTAGKLGCHQMAFMLWVKISICVNV